MRVSQGWTLEGRLFQIAGAAERKPRAQNEKLQRVAERERVQTDTIQTSSLSVLWLLWLTRGLAED